MCSSIIPLPTATFSDKRRWPNQNALIARISPKFHYGNQNNHTKQLGCSTCCAIYMWAFVSKMHLGFAIPLLELHIQPSTSSHKPQLSTSICLLASRYLAIISVYSNQGALNQLCGYIGLRGVYGDM